MSPIGDKGRECISRAEGGSTVWQPTGEQTTGGALGKSHKNRIEFYPKENEGPLKGGIIRLEFRRLPLPAFTSP